MGDAVKIINGEEHTQDTVMVAHKGLIHRECNKVRIRGAKLGLEYDDLYSVGSLGMLKAFRKFDYKKFPVRFSTYATPMIWGELQRLLRDTDPGVKYTRSVKTLAWEIRREELEDLSVEAIAEKLAQTVDNVTHSLNFLRHSVPVALDKEIDGEGDMTVSSSIGVDDDLTVTFVQEFLETLTSRDRIVIERRMEGMGQVEISEEVGVSQVQVSRIIKQIGKKYLTYLSSDSDVKSSKKEVRMVKREFTEEEVKELREQGLTYTDIAKRFGVSKAVLHTSRNNWNLERVRKSLAESKVNPIHVPEQDTFIGYIDESNSHEIVIADQLKEITKLKALVAKAETFIREQAKIIEELEEKERSQTLSTSDKNLLHVLVEREYERMLG